MMVNESPSDAPQPLSREIPIPAIKWFLHNNCQSNVQLATLANVCKSWRHVCYSAVVLEAISLAGVEISDFSLLGSLGEIFLPVLKESVEHDRHSLPHQLKAPRSTLQLLFLTDMARELIVRRGNALSSTSKQSKIVDGNFCLAWFAPNGIQITSVSLDDNDEDGTSIRDDFKFNFGVEDSMPNETNGNSVHRTEQLRKKTNKSSGNSVSCCREWRGYRHATEVLTPFGYATSFVRDVLDAALRLTYGNILSEANGDTTAAITKSTLTRSSSELSQTRMSKVSSLSYNPTFSVRGATLARSEGYCLCLDNEYISQYTAQKSPGCIDSWMNHSLHQLSDEHDAMHTGTLSPRLRAMKQSTFARALLPRVIMSSKRKSPIMHRFEAEDADHNKGHRDPSIHDPHEGETRNHFSWEKRQRAVQFLNCDKSQAVRLITPPFSCGGIQGPITMFIVAITSEDGCFVSGRRSRFEFGHIYPLSNRDMMADLSPICIATGNGNTNVEEDTSYSSDDSDRSTHCLCKFDSSDPFCPKDNTINDPSEDCIHRGTIGPGLWHCYVAVFDGPSSFIRVDGELEPQRTTQHYDMEKGDNAKDDPSNAGRLVGSGILDGLTIGSDHHFDMSLCYGEIDGECGQGAISELAVFKGRMDISDITKLEIYLMKKHGIPSVKQQQEFISGENETRSKPIRIGNHWEEDEWRRQAHALIAQRSPWDLVGEPVPLRVAANHNSVSWQRVDDITGMPIRVSRIGHSTGNGSSDW